MLMTRIDSNVDLKTHLPAFITKEDVIRNIADVESKEHKLLIAVIEDLFDQLFVDTATWGLNRWEKLLNLTPLPTDNYEQRRLKILLRLQRKIVSTKKFMETLALRYMDNDSSTKLIEYNSNYSFKIILDGHVNYPKDLRDAIELYKPAHLGFCFEQLVKDLLDEVTPPTESDSLHLSLNYEDIIPYGTNHPLLRSKNLIRTGSLKRSPQLFRGNYKRGFQSLTPLRKPFENLNIDEIALNLNFNFEDNLVDYIRRGGAIQHRKDLKRGTTYNSPLDLRLNSKICISYEDSVNVQDRDSKIMVMQTPKRGQLVRGSNLFRGSKFFGNDVEILKPPKRGILSRGTFSRRSYTIVR